jgi:MoaA/NifB/PqqE/SkfB family radical SAM enzyme
MQKLNFMKKPDYIELKHANQNHDNWFVVNWCLGNTCNYECNYCPSHLHDGSIKWPDVETIKKFIKFTVEQVFPKKVYFEMTGGEVTMYRHFEEICKYCDEIGAKVGLISNGSRTLRWWEENKYYFNHVCLSFHPEQADPDHFFNVVNILHDQVRTHVNIMMSPEKFDYCFEFAKKCKDIPNISMALQPLIHDFGDTLYNYTEDQKEIFNKQHSLLIKDIKHTKSFDYYRGAMKKIFQNGTTEIKSAHSFISNQSNDWSGWKCYSGVEQIIVDLSGDVYRGWCKLGYLGNINNIVNIPSDPIICTKTMCHCNFDIMSTKIKA